jgi:hypothetical protein
VAESPTSPGAARTRTAADTDRWWRLRHLPTLLMASAVVTIAAAVVGWQSRGAAGAVGAAIGVGVATASYSLSTLLIAWADSLSPQLVLPVGAGAYVAKFSVLLGVMILLGGSDWPGLLPMAWGIVAGVVGWTAAQIWWFATMHVRTTARR